MLENTETLKQKIDTEVDILQVLETLINLAEKLIKDKAILKAENEYLIERNLDLEACK